MSNPYCPVDEARRIWAKEKEIHEFLCGTTIVRDGHRWILDETVEIEKFFETHGIEGFTVTCGMCGRRVEKKDAVEYEDAVFHDRCVEEEKRFRAAEETMDRDCDLY